MKKLIMLILLGSVFHVTNASAETYLEFDTMLLTLEESTPLYPDTYQAEPSVLAMKVGVGLSPLLGFEGLLGLGIHDDEFGSTDLDVGLNSLVGFYLMGKLPIGYAGTFFGKAGLASLEYEDSDGDRLYGSGFSYGFGAKFNMARHMAIVAEYMVFPDVEYEDGVYDFPVNGESDSVNIGLQLRF